VTERQRRLRELYEELISVIAKKLESLKREGKKIEPFVQALDASDAEFSQLFINRFEVKKNVEGLLLNELFDRKKELPDNFNISKFWILRALFENRLLKKLVLKYEACLQELIEIDRELEMLNNN